MFRKSQGAEFASFIYVVVVGLEQGDGKNGGLPT